MFSESSFFFILLIQAFEFIPIAIRQAGRFVRAEQRPHIVALNTLHEQIRYPHRIEKVARAHLFFAVILLEFQEFENIGVPGLQIDRKTSFAFATSLVNVPRGHIKIPEHGDNAIGRSTGPFDVRTFGAHAVNAQPDASCRLRNLSSLFQGVIDAVNAVVLHRQQEARRELGLGCAGVEQGGGGVGKPFLREQIIGFDNRRNIFSMDPYGHTHQ